MLLGLGCLVGLAIGGQLAAALPRPGPPWLQAAVNMGAAILAYLPPWALLWGWLAGYEGRSLITIGLGPRRAARRALRGFGLGLATLLVGGVVLVLAGARLEGGYGGVGAALRPLPAIALSAVTQEAIFRGWLLPVVAARWGVRIGLVTSAGLFAAAHALNPGAQPLALANLALMGWLLGVYALGEGSLWGVSGWHAAWNWGQGALLGLPSSGYVAPAALLHLDAGGVPFWAGGLFGLEGGLGATCALTAALTLAQNTYAARRKVAQGA